jgi:hypothetical protein
MRARANPAKVEDFGDKDLLQDVDLARILFGEVIHFAGMRARSKAKSRHG